MVLVDKWQSVRRPTPYLVNSVRGESEFMPGGIDHPRKEESGVVTADGRLGNSGSGHNDCMHPYIHADAG